METFTFIFVVLFLILGIVFFTKILIKQVTQACQEVWQEGFDVGYYGIDCKNPYDQPNLRESWDSGLIAGKVAKKKEQ